MKKTITVVIIVLLAVGLGYWLFKLSPQQGPAEGYNALLNASDVKEISGPLAFDPAVDRYIGNKDAKNVFVEYGDMQCPACATYNDILKQVPSQFPDTVYVFRYFPLIQIHKNSVEAALANEAAGAQGKYWEMHDVLFQEQGEWENSLEPSGLFAKYAQRVGVANIEQFKNDITSHAHLPAIQKNYSEALGLKVLGTPTMFFNGHQLQPQDLEGMKKQAGQWMVK